MTNHRLLLLPICLSIFVLSSCKTNLLVIEDVLPTAQFASFEPKFHQNGFKDFSLEMDLTYLFRNPYPRPLPIPTHRMGIRLNEDELPNFGEETDITVPANSSSEVVYSFTVNQETLNAVLGKQGQFTFHTSVDIDVSRFADLLPNYQLNITDQFNIDSSTYAPLLRELASRKIEKRTLELEKSIPMKIPAPPTISKSIDPIQVEWIGSGWNAVNLNDLKETLTPFADLLISGKIGQLTNPFVKTMLETSIKFPAPKLNCLDCTIDVNLADQALNMARPFDPQINTKWNNLKNLVYIDEQFSATDYFVDNFLSRANPDALRMWNAFNSGWQTFKNTELPASLPSLATQGFRLSIPFVFHNNNDFPISVPLFRSSAFLANGEPFSIQLRTEDLDEVSLETLPQQHTEIPANQQQTMYVTFALNWNDSANGIYGFLSGQPIQPNLRGVMSYDFGYGPLFFNYDLTNLNLNHNSE
ncbi:MAG: hypothetical protein WBA23_14955 [Tunicatimonas sp.]|uniref:hypothetical protein n=1 Tax=Tunicatimonas sp. TaxID=1940096 RepID=UPI003C76CF3B